MQWPVWVPADPALAIGADHRRRPAGRGLTRSARTKCSWSHLTTCRDRECDGEPADSPPHNADLFVLNDLTRITTDVALAPLFLDVRADASVPSHRMNKSAGITLIFSLLVAGLVSLVAVSNPSNRPANIILISVDTLRADHLGAYGYRRNTSGFIDSIASRGAIFEDVVVPMPATDPSHATMMTGLHPLRTGLLSNAMQLRNECETVAEVLRARGYATAAVTAVYHLAPGYGFGQGFDVF